MFSYLDVGYWSQIQGLQPPRTLLILPEIRLAANQDYWCLPAEVPHLWVPLGKQSYTKQWVSPFFLTLGLIELSDYSSLFLHH